MNDNKEKPFFLLMDNLTLDEGDTEQDFAKRYDSREEAIKAAKKDQTEYADSIDGDDAINPYNRVMYVLECTDVVKFHQPELVTEHIKGFGVTDLRNNPSANQIAI